jgi:hypothetical protein
MNKINQTRIGRIGVALCAISAGALTGCVAPRERGAYVEAPVVYVESGPVVEPEYVYYPGYQVYYSSHTRQYSYQQGRSWVSRPEPPRVSARVLLASPSVRMDFHDSPASHHAAVVRRYPKQWAPAASHDNKEAGHDQTRR